MPLEFDHLFWTSFNLDVTFHRKWYLSGLSDKLLQASFPDNILNTMTPSKALKVQFRRSAALQLRNDPKSAEDIFQAFSQICSGQTPTEALQKFQNSHLINPLEDYANHLYYFSLVAKDMESKNVRIAPLGANCSRIHDLDKLDPIMLAAYAERFEDGLETDLWTVCVKNHVTSNPHHPEHPIWQPDGICNEVSLSTNECSHCEGLRFLAVREMICDRVSRRAQKELGAMSPVAWDISPTWFSDLPPKWFDISMTLIKRMKEG